jgi:hypothetical protein
MEQVKQTAVEWLIEQLTPSISLQQKHIDELKEKAKAMEKEQISQAYTTGVEEDVYINPLRTGKMYYNETYGGNK